MLRLVKCAFLVATAIQALLFVALFVSPSVSAAPSTGTNLTTSPISVDLTANPGSSTSTTLQLQNNGLQPVNISLKLDEFKASGDEGSAQIFTPPPGDEPTQWVHFSPNSFVAQPGVWNSVTMTVQVPKTAAYGYYYAVLFVPGTTTAVSSTEKVKGANAIFVLLNAHVPNENNTLNVQSFTASKASYQYLPASFNVNVRNDGNVFTVPQGDIFISRTRNGRAIDTLDINSGQGNILPQSNRVFQVQWTNGFPVYQIKRIDGQIVANKHGPIQQLKWDFTKVTSFRYGKYYAHLVLVYNNGSRDVTVNGVVSFWVVPWSLIAYIILTIVGIIVFWEALKRLIKKLRHKIGKK
jgi:hypothetical protein